MPAFLKDVSAFLGTGEKNEDGQTLEEFLEEYDPYAYKNPAVTADILVLLHPHEFTTVNKGMKVLMVKRRNHPSIGCWALPGGFVNVEEDLDVAAKRELEEETGLTGVNIEMVTTYGEADRDPRSRIITSSFVALVDETMPEIQAGDDAADACFVDISLENKGAREEVHDGVTFMIETYELGLKNEQKSIDLHATVEKTLKKEGILKEKKFKVVKNDGIAFDHPRFIVETLLYVEEKI